MFKTKESWRSENWKKTTLSINWTSHEGCYHTAIVTSWRSWCGAVRQTSDSDESFSVGCYGGKAPWLDLRLTANNICAHGAVSTSPRCGFIVQEIDLNILSLILNHFTSKIDGEPRVGNFFFKIVSRQATYGWFLGLSSTSS